MEFYPSNSKSFSFDNFHINASKVHLRYTLDDVSFEEVWDFNKVIPENNAVKRACELLHLIAGISYYKAALPKKITISYPIAKQMAAFLEKLYFFGLQEFAYQNKLDLSGRIKFPYTNEIFKAEVLNLKNEFVIPIGGGKDSLVTMQAVKSAGLRARLIAIGNHKIFQQIANQAQMDLITIDRKVDGKLIELNKAGALNGHVPISAIIAAGLTVAAAVYDYNCALLSNENSSNSPNTEVNGIGINHQYSKSLEFENDFREIINSVVYSGFNYVSFLRSLSELEIARLFLKTDAYDRIFSSCNSSFKITQSNSGWCADCPKCRFVFLILAAFSNRSRLEKIFGKNLLQDTTQLDGYRQLLGFAGIKPFECVGEVKESKAAFKLLAENVEWQDMEVVKTIVNQYPQILSVNPAEFLEQSFPDNLTPQLRRTLDEFRRN